MRIAFFAFPRITLLDLVGVYDPLRRVSAVTHRIIGTEAAFTDDSGFRIQPDGVYEDLAAFDLLVVPGGHGTRPLTENTRCIEYLRSWGETRPIASVCTGSLLLGHAGHLRGLRATTHHSTLEALRPLCKEVVADRRVVDEGRVVTAGGVTSALDLGLYLVEKFFGEPERVTIAKQMAYRAYSPQ